MSHELSRFEIVLIVKRGTVRVYDTDNGIEVDTDPDMQGVPASLSADDIAALQRAIDFVVETRGV